MIEAPDKNMFKNFLKNQWIWKYFVIEKCATLKLLLY